jgi:flagellar assembly protein FliH
VTTTLSSEFKTLPLPELRAGDLTRFGGPAVLGDTVTELALSGLVEDARSAAQSQGYATGWAEGRREAAAQAAVEAAEHDQQMAAERVQWHARQQAALQALQSAAAALEAVTAEVTALVQEQAVGLARELTESMVGHELRTSAAAGTTGADLAARVLAEVPAGAAYVVRVHPEVARELTGLVGGRVLPDAAMLPADAVVELDEQVLDLRVSTALERVRSVLA